MATYLELRKLFSHNQLKNQIEVACAVAARTIQAEDGGTTNHANRLTWAKSMLLDTKPMAEPILKVLLADNKDESVETIVAVSPATLQALVDGVVDIFADGS